MSKKKPHKIDIHVGKKIKQKRELLGISQQKLGEHLGITWQQIQKYEKGINRVSVSRLWDIAQAFETNIPYFYQSIEENPTSPDNHLQNSGNYKLIHLYYRITDEKKRKSILNMMKALSK